MGVTAGLTYLCSEELSVLKKVDPEDTYDYLETLEDVDGLPRSEGLDKAWDGLGFLWRRSGLLSSPFTMDPDDGIELANGMVAVLNPALVNACAEVIEGLSFSDLRGSATSADLSRANLYPFGNQWDDTHFNYLESWFLPMKAFFAGSSGKDYYLLYEIC